MFVLLVLMLMLMSWVFSLAYASVCAYAYAYAYALVKTSLKRSKPTRYVCGGIITMVVKFNRGFQVYLIKVLSKHVIAFSSNL